MDHDVLDDVAGHPRGSYRANPEKVYLDFQLKAGVCINDQWLATNPLGMGAHGYESGTERGATTGAEAIVLDGMTIDSPEAVAEHMEKFEFPKLRRAAEETDPNDSKRAEQLVQWVIDRQRIFGPNMLKVPYGYVSFPCLRYGEYGYENYFMAYALFPELMERDFALQADLQEKENRIAARAFVEGGIPAVNRLDSDMADSRGTLVDIRSLDRIWFPHFARAIKPALDAGIRLLWHCDGNLMQMVPRLIEVGVGGFQGFQYEDGMDYERICRMTDREGNPLMVWAGASVTQTLPMGTAEDVRRELRWLVDNGPKVGLFLAASSSIVPGTNPRNVKTLIEGLNHYRQHGRG
jgi:hypothetical protein